MLEVFCYIYTISCSLRAETGHDSKVRFTEIRGNTVYVTLYSALDVIFKSSMMALSYGDLWGSLLPLEFVSIGDNATF